MSVNFTLQDNSAAILQALNTQLTAACEQIGMKAANNTAELTPVGTPESTGIEGYVGSRLRNSMTYRVVSIQHGRTITVGSALFYASFVELGTGVYAEGGVRGYWIYVIEPGKQQLTPHKSSKNRRYTEEQAKKIVAIMNRQFKKEGNGKKAFYTTGRKPVHMLKRGIEEHLSEYKDILEQNLKG